MHALPSPAFAGVVSRTTWQPGAVIVTVVLGGWYLHAVRRFRIGGGTWPARRSATFIAGLALFAWTTCGWLEVYRTSLFWAWTAQILALMLIVPLVILAGQPLQLSRLRSGKTGWVDRFLRSTPGKFLANPLVGPALVPLLSVALFFGPLPSWAVQAAPVAWVTQVVVLAIGGLIVLPLVGPDESPSSLAVGLGLAIGSLELVLDAVPGVALRLHTTLVSTYFAHRATHPWSPAALHDQQIAGATLWCVAEVIDLPFLLLVFRRWLRADARDAAEVDAVLEAERAARTGLGQSDPGQSAPDDRADAPWWLTDPAMQRRYRDGTR
ncbi:MAG: cytochrome c oxidase assembly protein [Actinomycetota bacterium]|nr:cytochrome c oxidase assembly protein [Actinomycetota bacterium]